MRYVAYLFIVSVLCACSFKRDDLRHTIAKWYDKEIIFPEGLSFVDYEGEKVCFPDGISEYKVVSYINDENCVLCKLKLELWKELMDYLGKKHGKEIPFLFYINYENHADIEYIFKNHKWTYPFCMDDQDCFNKMNQLPKDDRLHTFLLDKDNRVVAIGNPTTNRKVRDLYAKLVAKEGEKIESTSACVLSPSFLNCGNLRLGKTYEYLFQLQNVKQEIVKIDTILSSCECMKIIDIPSQINPSGFASFKVIYHADTEGEMFKTIHVYLEGEESPLMATIEGSVR